MYDLPAEMLADRSLEIGVNAVVKSTEWAYYSVMKDASLKKRRDFVLDVWLGPYVHRRALISLSLHAGMDRIDEIQLYAERKIREWIWANPMLAPPT
jgi:hypothetical protein